MKKLILWKMVRKLSVKGHLYNVLLTMYKTVNACVKCNGSITDFIKTTEKEKKRFYQW